MNEEQKDFYKRIRTEIKEWLGTKSGRDNLWADYILLAPDLFHLLIKLSIDKQVPLDKKVRLGAVIAYFILPLDFFPEILLGPIGYLDDIFVSAYILNEMFNTIDPKIILHHWAGDRDLLNTVRSILANANEYLNKGIIQKLKDKFNIKL